MSEYDVVHIEEATKQARRRQKERCAICQQPGVLGHEVYDARLFGITGARGLADNTVYLCREHHYEAMRTNILPEELIRCAGISAPALPPSLEKDQAYDRFGNPVLANGNRMIGELYYLSDVQALLEQCDAVFTRYVKAPRTLHLPWSEGRSEDDKVMHSLESFEGREVVVTIKMDGESTTMYSDYLHARSIDGRHHPSRDYVKNLHASIAWRIPEDMRIVGENCFAKHSIGYDSLPSYFLGFHVWRGMTCLSHDDTMAELDRLGLCSVDVIWRGTFDESVIRQLCAELDPATQEGLVVRLADEFSYGDFRRSVAKYVRKDHVQTNDHWSLGKFEKNGLAG